jgi:hypothetical protein
MFCQEGLQWWGDEGNLHGVRETLCVVSREAELKLKGEIDLLLLRRNEEFVKVEGFESRVVCMYDDRAQRTQ